MKYTNPNSYPNIITGPDGQSFPTFGGGQRLTAEEMKARIQNRLSGSGVNSGAMKYTNPNSYPTIITGPDGQSFPTFGGGQRLTAEEMKARIQNRLSGSGR